MAVVHSYYRNFTKLEQALSDDRSQCHPEGQNNKKALRWQGYLRMSYLIGFVGLFLAILHSFQEFKGANPGFDRVDMDADFN